MNNADEYEFVKISLKKDVASQIDTICKDIQEQCGIFVAKSDLLRIMTYDKNVVEYVVKKIVYDKKNVKLGDLEFSRQPTL